MIGPLGPEGTSGSLDDAAQAGELSTHEIRNKAVQGVAAVGIRSLGVRALGLVANIVLARLLLPSDFGVLAFGQTILFFGALLTDVGFAAALIRQKEEPAKHQMQAFFGFQLLFTTVLSTVITLALLPLGMLGAVAAAMGWSVVIASIGSPRVVVLERRLDYASIAYADIASAFVYAVLAIALVASGMGVWGVVVAQLARGTTQSSMLILKTRGSGVFPRLAWEPLRGSFSFGVQFQANNLLNLGREQAINIGTLALAGTATLGLWSLAQRLLLVPYLLFESLWRVGFPALARMVALDADPSKDVERALRLASVFTGLMLVGLTASAPTLIPSIFGAEWGDSAWVISIAGIGLLCYGPISAAGAGFLFATGEPRRVLAAAVSAVLVWAAMLPILLPLMGVKGNGICWLTAALVESVILGRALTQRGIVVVSAVTVPVLVALSISVPILILVGDARVAPIVAGLTFVGSSLLYVLMIYIARPAVVRDLVRVGRRMARRIPSTAEPAR